MSRTAVLTIDDSLPASTLQKGTLSQQAKKRLLLRSKLLPRWRSGGRRMVRRPWVLPMLLGLSVSSCGRNRAVEINARQVQAHLGEAIVVLGVRFAGPVPPELGSEYQISGIDPNRVPPAILIPPPPRGPGIQKPETGRSVMFQRTGEDRCFSFWDKIEVTADFDQTKTRYVAWSVPPGTYAGPPTHSGTSTTSITNAFVAQKEHVTYWGDFAIDARWDVTRSVNAKAAEAALGQKTEAPDVGTTGEMSTGVVCTP